MMLFADTTAPLAMRRALDVPVLSYADEELSSVLMNAMVGSDAFTRKQQTMAARHHPAHATSLASSLSSSSFYSSSSFQSASEGGAAASLAEQQLHGQVAALLRALGESELKLGQAEAELLAYQQYVKGLLQEREETQQAMGACAAWAVAQLQAAMQAREEAEQAKAGMADMQAHAVVLLLEKEEVRQAKADMEAKAVQLLQGVMQERDEAHQAKADMEAQAVALLKVVAKARDEAQAAQQQAQQDAQRWEKEARWCRQRAEEVRDMVNKWAEREVGRAEKEAAESKRREQEARVRALNVPVLELAAYEDKMDLLGEGTYGWVYRLRATHCPQLGTDAAVKVTKTSRLDILREAELQRDLAIGCNSSLPVLAVVVDAQGHAVGFAMPLCEGNLAEIVYKPDCALSASAKLQVLRDIAQQLAAMHEHGTALLDVKALNVLVVGYHRNGAPMVKLSDFGGAARMDWYSKVATAGGIGTESHIAPEMLPQFLKNGQVDGAACDIFSAGALFEEVLLGPHMIIEESISRLQRCVMDGIDGIDFQRVAEKLAKEGPAERQLGAQLAALMTQMTAPDPAERPSMRVVARRLAEMQQGLGTDKKAAAVAQRRQQRTKGLKRRGWWQC